jgi:hypothetical protein
MSALVMSIRSSAQNPARVLAVWLFCIATIVFWIGVLHYVAGMSGLLAAALICGLGLASIPFSSHLIPIIWPPEENVGG